MRLAGGTLTLRGALLLLGLWELLAPVKCSKGRPSWRYISSEVVIPRKQTSHGRGMQVPGWLSYSLHFGGQRHIIHMQRKKIFLPRHLPVVTQDDQGASQTDYPYIPQDCHYLGFLEAIPQSMVTIATCYGGLEGIMKLDDFAYEIKPLKDSHIFEHVVSEIVADINATGPTYRLGYKSPSLPKATISAASRISSKVYASHPAIMQSLITASTSIYRLTHNVTTTTKSMIDLGGLVDTMYHTLDIRYTVVGVVVNTNSDHGNVADFGAGGNYRRYYATEVFPKTRTHTAVLLNLDLPNDLDFEATSKSSCTEEQIVIIGQLGRHHILVAVVVSFQTGRTLGIEFDGSNCYCQRRTTCIMYRYPVITDVFSNCSIVHLQHSLGNEGHCIYQPLGSYLNEHLRYRCGNTIVEGHEECDCGSLKQCFSSECCKTDCTLSPGSSCHEGSCCTNCSYSPMGTLCRPIQNICDLPEYCPGHVSKCPDNFYLQDGTPCTEEGYCYEGNCTDRSMHCKEIFGEDAVNADDACYSINSKGSRFGHCRREIQEHTFQRCEDADVLCGRLQCRNVSHLPTLQDHVSFHQSWISGLLCFGLDEHRSTETTDVGHVRIGTLCGPGKFCTTGGYCNGTLAALNYDCVPEKCSYRGMCNNRGNCHCHVGWGPPLCLSPGPGGSVDSGPPPRRFRKVSYSEDYITFLRIAFLRLYLLIGALLLAVATNVKAVQTTEVKKQEYDAE